MVRKSRAVALAITLAACGGGSDGTQGPPPNPDSTLGPGVSLGGRRPFPDDNPWNTPVDLMPVDSNSGALIASIGVNGAFHPDFGANWNGGPFGIPYIVVDSSTPLVPVTFQYDDESDPGPYPIPGNVAQRVFAVVDLDFARPNRTEWATTREQRFDEHECENILLDADCLAAVSQRNNHCGHPVGHRGLSASTRRGVDLVDGLSRDPPSDRRSAGVPYGSGTLRGAVIWSQRPV